MRYSIPVILIGLVLGCRGDGPTAAQDAHPSFGSGSFQCYAVAGALDQAGGPDLISGTISGDVEGTVVTVGGPAVVRGVAVSRPGEQTWAITGGSVIPLIGQTLHLDVDVGLIAAKAPLLLVNTTARVVEGAQNGNLTYHGTTDVSSFPFTSHLEYNGVICP